MPLPWRLLVLLFFLLSASVGLEARPKKDEAMPVPPVPISGRAQGYLKESFWIVLQASGRIEEPLEFLIRKEPLYGALRLPIQRTGPKTAKVLYTPFRDAMPGEDFFTYAVQSEDSPVSVSARIDIDLRLRPARLSYSRHLDFGTVHLGDTLFQPLRLANQGGSPFPLEIRAHSPWEFDSSFSEDLAAGAATDIVIAFRPTEVGDFKNRLTLSADGTEVVFLSGSCIEPFSWSPRGVDIFSEKRAGGPVSISFLNRTDKPRRLVFEWPENIVATREIQVPPGESHLVPVEIRRGAPPTYAFRGVVRFRSGNFTGSFPLVVHPAPARLSIDPPGHVDLGPIPPGKVAKGQFKISNIGGLPAAVRMEAPKGFKILPEPSGLLIDPETTKEFEVSTQPRNSGEFSYPLDIFSGDQEVGCLNLRVSVRANPEEEDSLPDPSPTPPGPSIPLVREVSLLESTPHTITIRWSVPESGAQDFFIERREIRPGSEGRPEELWVRWDSAHIEVEGGTATARFRKLAAGSFWNIRMRSHDDTGVLNPPPPGFFRIETRPLPPLFPRWFWWAVGAVALFLLRWIWKKFRVTRQENLAARIEKLGPR